MAPRLRHVAARGFTLLELLVGSTASLIVLAGIASAFIAIQRSYHAEAQTKGVVEGSRLVTSLLERELRMAGYGIDPRFAFDFTTVGLPGVTKDNFPGAGFVTDDLAYRYRDPTFLRIGFLSNGNGTLNIVPSAGGATLGVTVRPGTGLLIVCPGGTNFRLKRASAVSNGNTVTVIDGGWGSSTEWTTHSCMNDSNAPAYVMLVREARIRIVDLGGRPYLVRFNNLNSPADPINTNTDFDPLGVDVEAFQISYVMNRPAAAGVAPDNPGNQDWIIGNAANETTPLPGVPAPTYDTSYTDATRFNAHPANIRAVRVSVVMKAPSPRQGGGTASAPLDVENLDVVNTPDAFHRSLMTTSVRTPNLLSRASFAPPIQDPNDPDSGCTAVGTLQCDNLNVWGG